ncbi:MAG: protein-export chaperone SecB [Gammaproteobacteria bacterium]|nr:protein-export chaperone SecB [Gammaproteobacteria bacterium]MDH5345856.1 protein-export chaperone SecB [Gammaproteobacteria bacterium]
MAEDKQKTPDKQLAIQKIYIKDFSFESPGTPQVFTEKEWAPKTDLNLRSSHTSGSENNHEIVLTVTIEAKVSDKTVFLVELQQAGLFHISGYSEEDFKAIVGSFCPNILFPYARETIASVISKGGFPEFILQPINFDALYAQGMAQVRAKASAEGGGNGGSAH